MNLPNLLTVFRILLTPFFLLALVLPFTGHFLVALVLFIVASLTDYFDGRIARDQHLITDFGKFLDPIADKMLTTAAFLGFMVLGLGWGAVWITFIVLTREFLVASVRMIVAAKGTVLAADMLGKTKTCVQMGAIIAVLAIEGGLQLFPVLEVARLPLTIFYNLALWASVVFTAISGVNYVVGNKEALGLK